MTEHRTDAGKMREIEAIVEDLRSKYNTDIGGPGSGNWGHRGRQGMRGGSAPGGGVHNRRELPHDGGYTSWSKWRDALARPHNPTDEELKHVPNGTKLITPGGKVYTKSGYFYQNGWPLDKSALAVGGVRLAIPKSTNPNIDKQIADFGGYRDRMEKAIRREPAEDVDKILRGPAGKAWKRCTERQKDVLYDYTESGYEDINNYLRFGYGGSYYAKQAKTLKSAIAKSELPQDMWLCRGINRGDLANILGVSGDDVRRVANGELPPSSLVGKKGKDNGFLSAGSTEGTGMDKNVIVHIFAPKGTKAMYAEPVSACGLGAGRMWDGYEKQKKFGSEFETIVQAGTSLQASRCWTEDGQIHVECFVTGQDK